MNTDIIKIQTENENFFLEENEELADKIEAGRGPAYLLTFDTEGSLLEKEQIAN